MNELCFFLFRYLKGTILQWGEMTYFVSDWLTLSYFHSVSSKVYLLLFILILFIGCFSFKYTKKLKNSNEIMISFDGGRIMNLKDVLALNLVELTGIFGVCFRC